MTAVEEIDLGQIAQCSSCIQSLMRPVRNHAPRQRLMLEIGSTGLESRVGILFANQPIKLVVEKRRRVLVAVQIHPGNGQPVNPYPTVRAIGC